MPFHIHARYTGTEKPFNRAGPGVGHDIDCLLRWIFMLFPLRLASLFHTNQRVSSLGY